MPAITRHLAAVAAAVFGAVVVSQICSAGETKITVSDGDTVRLDGKTYRLLGFDTPETYYARCDREFQLGTAAEARLRELIASGETKLESTGKSCKWRRTCARLFVNGEDVGDLLIREGHAVPYDGRGPRKNWCE